MRTNKSAHIIGSVVRTLLALTFLFSGFVKAVDPLGTVYKIEDYLKAFGGFFTDLLPLAGIAAVCLIGIEWLLGVCMLANIRTNITAWLILKGFGKRKPFYKKMKKNVVFFARMGYLYLRQAWRDVREAEGA